LVENYQEGIPIILSFQNQSVIEGELKCCQVGERNKVLLLTFIPNHNQQELVRQSDGLSRLWTLLKWIIHLLQTSPNVETIQKSLELIAQLIGCEQAWLYTAMPDDTALINSARFGEKPSLPELLPVDYLIQYQSVTIWSNPEPPDRELIQYAIQNNQNWMGVLPLGDIDARIGLVVLAAQQPPKFPFTVEQWQLIAQFITVILQYIQQIRNLKKDLAIQERENLIYRHIHQNVKMESLSLPRITKFSSLIRLPRQY